MTRPHGDTIRYLIQYMSSSSTHYTSHVVENVIDTMGNKVKLYFACNSNAIKPVSISLRWNEWNVDGI